MMVAHIPPVRNSRTLEIKSSCQKKQDGGGLPALNKKEKRKIRNGCIRTETQAYDRVTVSLWLMAPVVRYSLTKSLPLIRHINIYVHQI